MSGKNYIEKIAIVGAGGRMGGEIVKALLAEGKHRVTAITRPDSTSAMPSGVAVAKVSYDDPTALADALRGHDALVITMNSMAPPTQSIALVEAAAAAEVPWIMPNWYGGDGANTKLSEDTRLGPMLSNVTKRIEELRKSSWVALACSFWYEWSLFGPPHSGLGPRMFGFDGENRTVTFLDDGETKINTSTWPQAGLAVARLFALPIKAEGEGASLSHFKSGFVYVASFLISQKDMFESIKRVTKTGEKDWKISYEPSIPRYEKASDDFAKRGWEAPSSFAEALYSRLLYQNGDGAPETKHGLANKALHLPTEDIDEATKDAMKYAGLSS